MTPRMPDDTLSWTPNAKWPPHCCVPAFVHAALNANRITPRSPAVLSALLRVRVGAEDENPFGLPVAEPHGVRGVTASDAAQSIQALLADMDSPISFRYVPFNRVPYGMYEEVLHEALLRGLVVGLGLDVAKLDLAPRTSPALHVFRVIGFNNKQVTLFDDSRECSPAEMTRAWDEIELSVLAAFGGFWFFGPKTELALTNAPPLRRDVSP